MISCDAKQELDNLYNQVSSAMAAELSNRAEYMRQAAQPLVDFREYVNNDMKGTWRLVMNAYKKAYRNNDFYTKTISTYLKENGNNAKYVCLKGGRVHVWIVRLMCYTYVTCTIYNVRYMYMYG